MSSGVDAARARLWMPDCIAKIRNPDERETGEAILFGLRSIQAALEQHDPEEMVCPTIRIGEKASYRIVRGASGGNPLQRKLPFSAEGVLFVGQAAGVVDATLRGGFKSNTAHSFLSCLKNLARVLSEPQVVPMRKPVPVEFLPLEMRGHVIVYESIFVPIRIHYMTFPDAPPAIIWIDALPYGDDGWEDVLSDVAVREFG